jgi:hypothetical protein
MALIVIALLVVVLGLLGARHGVDSRDGQDWKDGAAFRRA